MVGWILLGLLLLFLGWLFWAPIRIAIDSEAGMFAVEWWGLGRLQWLPEKSLDRLYLSVWFFQWPIRLGPSEQKAARPKKPAKTERPRKPGPKKNMAAKTLFRMIRNVLRSFRIKRFYLVWDSDDFIWNARWYPVAWHFSYWSGGHLEINFQGRRELALTVENRLGRIAWAVLKTFTTKH